MCGQETCVLCGVFHVKHRESRRSVDGCVIAAPLSTKSFSRSGVMCEKLWRRGFLALPRHKCRG